MALLHFRDVSRLIGTLLCVMIPIQSFKVTHVELPTYLDPREWSELVCRYDTGGKNLMVLRWFREQEELIRYMPNQGSDSLHKEIQVYNSTWLTLESPSCVSSACSLRVLATTRPRTTSTTLAKFRCEISSDFTSSYEEDSKEDLVGYASPPRTDPTITGLPEFVEDGDKIKLNCSTDYSWPVPEITWYINDNLVRSNASTIGSVNDTFGLETRWDILEFIVTEEQLAGAASSDAGEGAAVVMSTLVESAGVMSVRCQSSLEEFGKSRSTEHQLQTRSHAQSSSLSGGSSIGSTSMRKLFIATLLFTFCLTIS